MSKSNVCESICISVSRTGAASSLESLMYFLTRTPWALAERYCATYSSLFRLFISSASTSMVKQSSAREGTDVHTSSAHNATQSHMRFFMDGFSFDDGCCRYPSIDPND